MRHTFLLIVILLSTTIWVACNNKEQLAQIQFHKADSLYQTHQFHLAKLELDSIITTYPQEIEWHTRAKDLLHQINVAEQENNLKFLDSLIAVKKDTLTPLMQNFEIIDDGVKKVMVHKKQKNINYYSRTYLKPTLDTLGNFFISSYYCGESNIHHNQIKVTAGKESVTSETVDADGLYNREFNDGGLYWEVVQYRDGKDNGAIDFIAQNAEITIKVDFIGKGRTTVWMEKPDKEAIRDGYEISFLLKEIAKLQQEKTNAYDELKRLGSNSDLNK